MIYTLSLFQFLTDFQVSIKFRFRNIMAAAMGSVAKNGREPDWGRFGLDDEKQPLNPSSAENGMEGGTANHENKELYGGQAQNKNELFAQDQV